MASYYSNVFNRHDILWMSTSLFVKDRETYDQEAIIDSNYHLNTTAVVVVGLPHYTTTYAISQLCYNLSLGSIVTYMLLWHWGELKAAFSGLRFLKRGHADIDDPHYNGEIP